MVIVSKHNTDTFYKNLRLQNLVLIVILFLIASGLSAQKLGLVLSGGGAPGIAHIGVLKALEENSIPIDYITSTSIGAIVGGMYAIGMSPDEMLTYIKSDEFKHLTTGEIAIEDQYTYMKPESTPAIVELFSACFKSRSLHIKVNPLPSSIVSPHEINYAFIKLCTQANATSKSDFKNLFVPFRCVASDVFNKQAVVFRNGDLANAIRASMTFPFVFKPIEINQRLLFDGGIYNNFPTDVMRSDFNPDYMIGSVVAYNPPKADKRDIGMLLQNMIIHSTDYSLAKKDGLVLNFDLKKFDTFDFSKADELFKIGYDSAIAHMPEIKSHITRRISPNEITERRKEFKSNFSQLNFDEITITGVDEDEKAYIKKFFQNNKDTFSLKEFKKAYYNLLSDSRLAEIVPHATPNNTTGYCNLKLDIEKNDPLKVYFGGNISSFVSNQAYVGVAYQTLSKWAQTSVIDGQFGKIYNGLSCGTRLELPTKTNCYMQLTFVIHEFNYQNTTNSNNYFTQNETYGKIAFGLPISTRAKLELGVGYGIQTDYFNVNPNSYAEKSKYKFALGGIFGKIENNCLNSLMYPTKGYRFATSLQYFTGKENNGILNLHYKQNAWCQLKLKSDRYFTITENFTMGTHVEFVYSNRQLLSSYIETLLQAPSFQPTPYTRATFSEAFRANQFAAIGMKPIYNFSNQFHLRTEAYWFIPYQSINRNIDNSVIYSKPFSKSEIMMESALVYNLKMASAGVFAHYEGHSLNYGINIGILLFKPKFTE